MPRYFCLIFIFLLSPATAHAESFDLECFLLEADGSLPIGRQPILYQIDLAAGRWCSGTCDGNYGSEQGEVIEADAATLSMREVSIVNSVTSIRFDRGSKILEWIFEPGTRYELVRHYRCEALAFSGMTPNLATPPSSLNRFAITSADFLVDADGQQVSGSVGIEMSISSDGTVGTCRVFQSSGRSELDAHTCNLVQERLVRFAPALDRQGSPIDSMYRTSVRWMGD